MSDASNGAAGTRVEFKVKLRGKAPTEPPPAPAPTAGTAPAEEVPRVARLLALAHRCQRLIDEGRVKDQAEIARLMGLSRARVTQIMELRWLAPAMQEAILLPGERCPRRGPLVERRFRQLAGRAPWAEQARAHPRPPLDRGVPEAWQWQVGAIHYRPR